jgi:hypothetical protein
MKRILMITLMAFFFSPTYSQINFDKVNPDTVYCFETNFDVIVHNNISIVKAGTYRWVRTHDASCGVTSAVCDKNQCYLDITDSAEFDVEDNETFEMQIHFYPNQKCCVTSTMDLKFFKVDEPSITTTARYNIRIYCASAGTNDLDQDVLNIYPNPVQSMLFLDLNDLQAKSATIFNSTGTKIMATEGSVLNNGLDVSSLTKGLYVVSVRTEKGIIRKTFMKD